MLVVFHDRFPPKWRRRVERLVKKYAKSYNLNNGWEVFVTTEVDPNHTASVDCAVSSHSIQLDLKPERMKNLRALEVDIAHELWHIVYWRTATAIQRLPKKYAGPLLELFEEDHDAASRIWLRHLFPKAGEGSA